MCTVVLNNFHVDFPFNRHPRQEVNWPQVVQPEVFCDALSPLLFEYVLTNTEHSLNELLPDRRHELTYSLRLRRHDLTLSRGSHRLSDCNFIVRLLFKDSYWSLVTTTCNLILVKLRPDSFFNKIILYCIIVLESFSVGAPPRTPLGELTTMGRGYPSPFSTSSTPSASRPRYKCPWFILSPGFWGASWNTDPW